MVGNKPISKYAIGEGTLRGEEVGRKRLAEEKTKGRVTPPLSKRENSGRGL